MLTHPEVVRAFVEKIDLIIQTQNESDLIEITIENQGIYKTLMLIKNGVLFRIFDQPIEDPKTLAKCLKIFNQEIIPGKNQMMLKISQTFDDSKIRQICSE